MNNQSYAVLCESELGLDEFGNPKGKPILMESVGGGLEQGAAIQTAERLKASGQYGDVKVVRLEVCNFIIKGKE